MLKSLGLRAGPVRLFGIAAAATLMLSAGTARRAEALNLINPASLQAAKGASEAASDGLVTQVRHGGGGHGGGHFHGGGGFRGGGGHIGGFRGGGFHGGHIGGFRAAPAFHGGGYRYGGLHRYGGVHRYGGFHRYGIYRPHHYGHRHFHRRYYVGGYYPAYHHPRRCRVIWTYYGPRRVCRWHRWHHPYRYW